MINKFKNKVIKKLKKMNNEDGMGTIEMIFLVAVLLSLAIMFGVSMKKFVSARITDLTDENTFDKVDPSDIDGRINIENRKIALGDKSYIEFDSNTVVVTLNQET